MMSIAPFDMRKPVAQCQTQTQIVHSRSFREEIKPLIIEIASVCNSEKM